MIVTINNEDYALNVQGTVGITFAAERMVQNGEKFDASTTRGTTLLMYSALMKSNKGRELPSYDDFIDSLTFVKLNELATFFWNEWNRVEGAATKQEGAEAKND